MKLNEMREKTVEELQGAIKRLIAQAKTVIKEKEVQHA